MCRETPDHTAIIEIERCPVVLNTSEVNSRSYLNNVSRCASGSILPTNRPGVLIKRVNVTDGAGCATLIRANQNQVTGAERIAVKTLLITILFNVVTPSHRPS